MNSAMSFDPASTDMAFEMQAKDDEQRRSSARKWRSFFGRNSVTSEVIPSDEAQVTKSPARWNMGILNDKFTEEVPGSVLLLTGERNEPLGLRNAPARTSTSSVPSVYSQPSQIVSAHEGKKKTANGEIVLEPQPDDSHNDPLNWPAWRRDSALLSLGFYCMLGGGMTPILAAGFTNVATTYDVTVPQVALTTGLYMLGLGIGSVFASPTAILYGKRPVYLVGCLLFIISSVWCALSPSYVSLVLARIFQGIAVSPVECLPSATIAEIFFLHERAFRLGIYTLLLLGGKNLIPLVSAAVIQTLGWPWVFWIVAMVVGLCWLLLFLFVPETFWDRAPRPRSRRSSHRTLHMWPSRRLSTNLFRTHHHQMGGDAHHDDVDLRKFAATNATHAAASTDAGTRPTRGLRHVGFAPDDSIEEAKQGELAESISLHPLERPKPRQSSKGSSFLAGSNQSTAKDSPQFEASEPRHQQRLLPPESITMPARHEFEELVSPAGGAPATPGLHNFNSPFYLNVEHTQSDYINRGRAARMSSQMQSDGNASLHEENVTIEEPRPRGPPRYTTMLKEQPAQTFIQQLKPFNGRLHNDRWIRVLIRPFILFAYPAVLWSSIVYACSVGWLIVLSESASVIFRSANTYNFSALSTGLIYLSPFIGGVLGTAVAGKVSDIVIKIMSRRNGGLYEPEFRLVMAIPVAFTTVIGLMGYGWSAQVHDAWIVPTIFFGIISFGCSLGSTTAITFCVDSYRQYAGEALVTLNFTKNVLHGLVFSLFFNTWLNIDGPKVTFVAIGIIQLGLMFLTIPMYIFGKRARMWTVRKNLMEKF